MPEIQPKGFFQQLSKFLSILRIFAMDDKQLIIFHSLHLLGRAYARGMRFLPAQRSKDRQFEAACLPIRFVLWHPRASESESRFAVAAHKPGGWPFFLHPWQKTTALFLLTCPRKESHCPLANFLLTDKRQHDILFCASCLGWKIMPKPVSPFTRGRRSA